MSVVRTVRTWTDCSSPPQLLPERKWFPAELIFFAVAGAGPWSGIVLETADYTGML